MLQDFLKKKLKCFKFFSVFFLKHFSFYYFFSSQFIRSDQLPRHLKRIFMHFKFFVHSLYFVLLFLRFSHALHAFLFNRVRIASERFFALLPYHFLAQIRKHLQSASSAYGRGSPLYLSQSGKCSTLLFRSLVRK